jgi:hypothetical protein
MRGSFLRVMAVIVRPESRFHIFTLSPTRRIEGPAFLLHSSLACPPKLSGRRRACPP